MPAPRKPRRQSESRRPPSGERLFQQPARANRRRRRHPGPAGNLKPAKDKSTERIDGIVALIMAIGRAMVAQDEPQPEYSLFFV